MSSTTSSRRPVTSPYGTPSGESGGSTRMPEWSSPRPSSRAEQSIPSESMPRIPRLEIVRPSGISVPSVASVTTSPGSKLNAPHQTWCSTPSPESTQTRWVLRASGCCSVRMMRAVTTPGTPPVRMVSSTGRPSMASMSDSSSRSSGSGSATYSRSQERRTFISELLREPDVAGEHLPEIGHVVALLRHAVDAEAEREAAPLLGIDAAGAQDVRVHHAASPELEPLAGGRLDDELAGRLGDREVAGPEAGREVLAEEGLG